MERREGDSTRGRGRREGRRGRGGRGRKEEGNGKQGKKILSWRKETLSLQIPNDKPALRMYGS